TCSARHGNALPASDRRHFSAPTTGTNPRRTRFGATGCPPLGAPHPFVRIRCASAPALFVMQLSGAKRIMAPLAAVSRGVRAGPPCRRARSREWVMKRVVAAALIGAVLPGLSTAAWAQSPTPQAAAQYSAGRVIDSGTAAPPAKMTAEEVRE